MQIHTHKSMQRLFFLILLLCTFTSAAENDMEKFSYNTEVKVLVSDREVVAGHIVRYKIRATGDKVVFPYIEQIDGVKVLERHERVTNMFHYMNGALKKERTTLILTFAPHHDMTIPSYTVEIDGRKYKTEPVKIKVAEASAQNRENSNKYLIHLRTDKKSVIVGEAILATVHLSFKFGVRLSKTPQYNKPEFNGFFAKEIGEEKVYDKDNRKIIELKYLLTPLYKGNFTVGPATAKLSVADRSRRDMFGRPLKSMKVPIASNTINIEVKEKPRESALVGSFSIENSLDRQSVKANKPVNFNIKITGDGSLEDFEFPDFEIDGVTIYSDDASITTDLNDSTISSSYSKKFVFISDHDFTIPARRISAYDINSKTLKYLETPSYDIEVKGAKNLALQKPQTKIPSVAKTQSNLKVAEKSMLDDGEPEIASEENVIVWWMMGLAFVSGMTGMLLLHYIPGFKMKESVGNYSEAEALKILYPHMSESEEIEVMVRKLYAKKNGDKNILIDKKQLKEILQKIESKNRK